MVKIGSGRERRRESEPSTGPSSASADSYIDLTVFSLFTDFYEQEILSV